MLPTPPTLAYHAMVFGDVAHHISLRLIRRRFPPPDAICTHGPCSFNPIARSSPDIRILLHAGIDYRGEARQGTQVPAYYAAKLVLALKCHGNAVAVTSSEFCCILLHLPPFSLHLTTAAVQDIVRLFY